LHTLLRGDATHLTRWATTLKAPSDRTTFFNFLASHDGIGLNPARGILPGAEIDFLVERCLVHGGFINYKHNVDGTTSPYEMNIVYFDAVNDPLTDEAPEAKVNRFMVAQAIMLSLAGVPGIYFHSLFGSRNDREAALQTGINRRINRQKFARAELEPALDEPASLRAQVFTRFRALLQIRQQHRAFSPRADQSILDTGPHVFAILRGSGSAGWVLCLFNVTATPVNLELNHARQSAAWRDLLSAKQAVQTENLEHQLVLSPYEVKWIAGEGAPLLLKRASSIA
jgi:sucrose phosphorylase